MDADGFHSSTDGVDNRYDPTSSLPSSKSHSINNSDNMTVEPGTSSVKDIAEHEDDANRVEASPIHPFARIVGNGTPSYQIDTASSSSLGSFQAQAVDNAIISHSRLLNLPPEMLIMIME